MDTRTVTLLCPDCDGFDADACTTCRGSAEVTRAVPAIDLDGSPEDAIPFDDDAERDPCAL